MKRVALVVAWIAVGAGFAVPAPARADDAVAYVTRDGGVHRTAAGRDAAATARRIARRPDVTAAAPEVTARAAWIPNDPGHAGGRPGGWQALQWNFLATPQGVNAPGAWDVMRKLNRPGGRGAVVAVLDSGVAYRQAGRVKASPDFGARIVRGYDFASDDRYPTDDYGHGTHVASTIAESTGNGVGVTGLAYGASIMPVKVLDSYGEGSSVWVARGIRYAARNGADVINLSIYFAAGSATRYARTIIGPALRYAQRKGVLVVAAAGNEGVTGVTYPGSARGVVAVGATTERGCLARYSNQGTGLDVVAPGGGADARFADDPTCQPDAPAGRDIIQMTFKGFGNRRFGLPTGYEGTSMAAPHVSAIAALIISSGVLGKDPAPKDVELRLEQTALDVGAPGFDTRYGWGKVDAFNALAAPVTP